MYTDGTKRLSQRQLQDRLGMSFPRDNPPEGWSPYEAPPPTFEQNQSRKESEARAEYNKALERGFTFDGGTFSVDMRERQRMTELVTQQNAGRGMPRGKGGAKKTSMTFTDAEGVTHELDGKQIVDLAEAGSNHVQTVDDNYKELMGQIQAAKTQADLDAIDVTTGWPK